MASGGRPGAPAVRHVRRRPEARGRRPPRVGDGRLRDVGRARARRVERGARAARAQPRQSRRRSRGSGPRRRRLVGRHRRSRVRRSTPTGSSWCAPTCSAGARAPPDRRRTPPTARPYGSRFPVTTIRDQVAVEVALADALGIDRWYAVVGGSMGGMRVLEWAVGQRERVERAVVISVGAQATAEEIALCHVQMRADPRRPEVARRRLLRRRSRRRAARGARDRTRHRSHQLPHRARARGAVRPRPPAGRGALRRRSLCGRVLHRLPRRQARPALRRQHLPRVVARR